jgi:hypothetical protein
MREFTAILLLAVVAALVGVAFAWSSAPVPKREAFLSLCWIRSCIEPAPDEDDDDTPHPMTDNSYWHQDGSLVYLRIEGAARRIYYDPHQTLDDADDDDDPDDLLFDGAADHGYWRGMAHIFDKRCDSSYAYSVEGGTRDHDRVIALAGHAPRIDDDCNIAGYDNAKDTLLFTFVAEAD